MVALTGNQQQLPLQHLQLRLAAGNVQDGKVEAAAVAEDDPYHGLGPVARNRMRLYSFYKPSLQAGKYSIFAEQQIEITDTEGLDTLKDKDGKPSTLRVWNRKVDPPTPPPAIKDNAKVLESDPSKPPLPGPPEAPKPPKPEPQIFEVMAPQFSLDPKLVDSYYPPDGHQDEANTIPHICFNDPHLPWERDAGKKVYGLKDPEQGSNPPIFRSMVPWLALLVFDPRELKLDSADEAKALGIPNFQDLSKVDMNSAENARGTFAMSVKDYLSSSKSRLYYEAAYVDDSTGELDKKKWGEFTDNSSGTSIIFPKKDLFVRMFKNPNVGDTADKPSPDDSQHTTLPTAPATSPVPASDKADNVERPDNIEAHKYLAHVRHINATGCPDAGIDQEGLFSVIISSRTGSIGITQPTPQICHLVSIEHIDSTLELMQSGKINADSTVNRIGLVSLFSWIYMGLPPNPVNFVTSLRNVLLGRQVLRPPEAVMTKLTSDISMKASTDPQATKVAGQLLQRFNLGYTIARWRTETGEEVAAFNRGPLLPQPGSRPKGLPGFSNNSRPYQIVDLGTGLADLSYSSAWELGKLLAISDGVFNSALMRFRSEVHNFAASEARKQETKMRDASEVVKNVATGMRQIARMSNGNVTDPARMTGGLQTSAPPRFDTPQMLQKLNTIAQERIAHLAISGNSIYNGLYTDGKPNSTDWTIIHNWIYNKMYLLDIPAHYLIPDPTFLPIESLRFFHIDDTWIDCLIDGALSVANHLDRDSDWIRAAIKATLNAYLSTPTDGIVPQIPSCGFILRSEVVKVMPDMRITAEWSNKDAKGHERHEVCRYTRMDDQTIMGLFDRPFEELEGITLAQPPHQQNFCLGTNLQLNPPTLEVQFRHLFTQHAPDGSWDPRDQADPPGDTEHRLANWISNQPKPNETKKWYDFDPESRMLNVSNMAGAINAFLNKYQPLKPGIYNDSVANACELALQLNNPSYYFFIRPKVQNNQNTVRVRNIFGGDNVVADLPVDDTPQNGKGDDVPAPVNDPSSGALDPGQGTPKTGIPTVPSGTKFPAQPTRMTSIELPPVVASPQNQLGPLHLSSQFTLLVFPDYKGVPVPFTNSAFDSDDFCPTAHPYLYDLVFSVRKDPKAKGSPFLLKEIVIDIPHEGATKAKPTEEALLMADYDGPGARMLSNQRFVIFLNRTSRYITARLIPRSGLDNLSLPINDTRTNEVSFRLAESYIAPITNEIGVMVRTNGVVRKRPRAQVSIMMYERYQTTAGDKIVSTEWFVIKKNNLKKDPGD